MTTNAYSLSAEQKQRSAQQCFTANNVGGLDRLMRTILGSVLLAGGMYSAEPVIGTLGAVLVLLSIPIIISAIIAWDPVYAIFRVHTATFRTTDTRYEKSRQHNANGGISNIGTIDRIFRTALASALLAMPGLLAGPVGYAAVSGTVAGIIIMMTAVTGWDPLYQLLKIRTVTLSTSPSLASHTPDDKLILIEDIEEDNEDIFQKAA